MSTYIVERAPGKYGGHQQEYVEHVQTKEIPETVEKIRRAIEEKQDLQQLFHDILSSLGTDRHALAVKLGSENAELFGLRRDRDFSRVAFGTDITPIGGPYADYDSRWLPRIQEELRKINPHNQPFQKTSKKFALEESLERKDSMELLIFKDSDLNPLDFEYNEYHRLCGLACVPVQVKRKDFNTNREFRGLFTDINAMQNLKRASAEDYKLMRTRFIAFRLRNMFKEYPRSDWSVVTMRSQVDGKMYALSQYMTWMCVDQTEDAIDRMTRESVTTIIHQDPFLIKDMLQDIAKLFKEAVSWNRDRDDLKTLKNRVALMEYELSHAMPFHRGSAAVAEWIEMAIYQYHGLTLRYNPEKMVNLEAVTSPLHEFMQNYDSMIELFEA